MDANLRKKVVVSNIDLPQEKGKTLSEREVLPLESPHNRHSDLFLMIRKKVTSIFDHFGGINSLLEGKKRVFIKPNGIDSKEYCYTRPEVLEAIILECQRADVDEIFVMENSTQCNMTRIVFSAVGYKKICKRTGVEPIYLDECEGKRISFHNPDFSTPKHLTHIPEEGSPKYDLQEFEIPQLIWKELIEKKHETFYINVPKLKTHSMAGVTLGIKNQWGFPRHFHRKFDHNYLLHGKLVDVLSYIKPDFTIIDGIEGTIHGHYPPTSLKDELVKPFRVLIGGINVVAVDIIGSKIFGLDQNDVPHLQVALERGFAEPIRNPSEIEIIGELGRFTKKYPTDLKQDFPKDVKIIKGKDLLCQEGCQNNPLALLQVLSLDYGGKGDFTIIMGKGFSMDEIKAITGKVLIAGHCAIKEVAPILIEKLGKKNVYLSDGCNNLAQTTASMLHIMKVNPTKLVPLNPIKAFILYLIAKWKGSTARVPSLLSKWIKTT